MKRTTKYVGLDIHQASTVASVREDSGRVIARSVLPTEGPALTEFIRGLRGAVHVAFEAGTQAQWVHELLVPLVDRVVVLTEGRVGHDAPLERLLQDPSVASAAGMEVTSEPNLLTFGRRP